MPLIMVLRELLAAWFEMVLNVSLFVDYHAVIDIL
jgi:hypothetical protein